MRFSPLHLLVGSLLLGLCCGCIRTDYVGQAYPERSYAAVTFFKERDEVPPGQFRIMGRLELTAPNGTDGYDIQDKLIAEATRRGADAVVLVSSEKVNVGMLPNAKGHPIVAATPKNPANVAMNGTPIEMNSFGEIQGIGGNFVSRFDIRVKALLLIHKEAYEAIRGNHQEDAEPVLMRADPSGKPIRLPKAEPDPVPVPAPAPASAPKEPAKEAPEAPEKEEKPTAEVPKAPEKATQKTPEKVPEKTPEKAPLPAPKEMPKKEEPQTPAEEELFTPAKGPLALPLEDPDFRKISPSPKM